MTGIAIAMSAVDVAALYALEFYSIASALAVDGVPSSLAA